VKEHIERGAAIAQLIINDELHAADLIKSIPAADVRPVVLCRDCKHEGLLSCPIVVIEKQQMVFINHDPEFFCASGERENANV
jgi:hypothetical protein